MILYFQLFYICIGRKGNYKRKDLADYLKTFDANQIFIKHNRKDYKIVKDKDKAT